jgi:hypothetical protein
MNAVTFLQLRPAESVSEIWAATRRHEGTLAVEVTNPTLADVVEAQKGGLLLISGEETVPAPAYVLRPDDLKEFRKGSMSGWRITIVNEGTKMAVADAMAFTRAAYLRTSRSTVSDAVAMAGLPGAAATVSTFVDTVEDAVAAISNGARDLLLRDWDTERIGELRDALTNHDLIERTAFPMDISYDDMAAQLESGVFASYLNQIDGRGRARPRTDWAPGRDIETPQPTIRISARSTVMSLHAIRSRSCSVHMVEMWRRSLTLRTHCAGRSLATMSRSS